MHEVLGSLDGSKWPAHMLWWDVVCQMCAVNDWAESDVKIADVKKALVMQDGKALGQLTCTTWNKSKIKKPKTAPGTQMTRTFHWGIFKAKLTLRMQSVLLIIVALPKQFKSWLHLASAHIRNMGISLSKPTSCHSKGTQTQMDVEYSDDTHIPLRNRQSKFCSAITISASHHCSIRVSMDILVHGSCISCGDAQNFRSNIPPFFFRGVRGLGMSKGWIKAASSSEEI